MLKTCIMCVETLWFRHVHERVNRLYNGILSTARQEDVTSPYLHEKLTSTIFIAFRNFAIRFASQTHTSKHTTQNFQMVFIILSITTRLSRITGLSRVKSSIFFRVNRTKGGKLLIRQRNKLTLATTSSSCFCVTDVSKRVKCLCRDIVMSKSFRDLRLTS